MTATAEHQPAERISREKISRPNPATGVDVLNFYINGDSTTRPGIQFHSTGEAIAIHDGPDEWEDSGDRYHRGYTLAVVASDEPDGYPTRVLMDDTLCSDWALEEAIRALFEIRRRRRAMEAAGSTMSAVQICDLSPKCDAPAVTVVGGVPVCREHSLSMS